jgi:hypothetical protein
VSRTSRVPYHQNVYDLLQLAPGESPEAACMIAEHEAEHGPLPASLREWYRVPNAVPLRQWDWDSLSAVLWFQYGDGEVPISLPEVLDHFAQAQSSAAASDIHIMNGHQMECRWWVRADGSDDPPVYEDLGRDDPTEWKREADTFSQFTVDWFGGFYHWQCKTGRRPLVNRPYANGLWLRTPDEPFAPPVMDFLTEQFGEPDRTPRPGEVTTYAFRPSGGTVRVTADEPSLTGGLSAWWVHAESADRLADLGRLLLPWGTLRHTLHADTDPGRKVLDSLRI